MISLLLKNKIPLQKRIMDLLRITHQDQTKSDALYAEIFKTAHPKKRVVNMSWCFDIHIDNKYACVMNAIRNLDIYYHNALQKDIHVAQILLQTQNELKTRLVSCIQNKDCDDDRRSILIDLSNQVLEL